MSANKDKKYQYAVSSDEDESTAISSQTVVKMQTFSSLANFAQLECNTDLNLPPSNWLTNSANSYGLQQALSHSTGYTSFRMAHMFPDCIGDLDVVSSAENIKNLLKLPYSSNSGISLMIHRVQNTLLIDDFDIHKYLLRQADDEWKWLKSFICDNILSGLGDAERRIFLKNKSREALQKKSLQSKFLYYSLTTGETGEQPELAAQDNRKQLDAIRPLTLAGPLLPEPSVEENVPDPQTNHTFNRNVVWTFEDIRMLIGTDMPIFGSANRPCISLRLRDMNQPINVLTGIDYWLDNLMCNVPEVVMCYHLDGLVQKYELIQTEDLPNLENSKFSPKVIRNVAQNILAFLKQNATKAGHTYWLFKGRNDDFVKLYDLTSLCMSSEVEESCEAPRTTSTPETAQEQNPFTVPVAMLLYKVARNMKNMAATQMSAKQAGSIKTLLDNCIQLLPKEKYPQIVTSSHYILSDLHVPASINPNAPNFSWADDESETHSTFDDDHHPSEGSDCEDNSTDGSPENVAMKNIRETLNEFHLEPNWKHNKSPPPIVGNVQQRCLVALTHIVDGLSCLQYFSTEKEDQAKEEERRKIRIEEMNPNIAKSNQAIPLPYQKLQPEPEEADPDTPIPMGWKEDDKNVDTSGGTRKSKRNRNKSISLKSKKGGSDTLANYDHIVEASDSPRSLLLKGKSGVIESWHVHLKLLLLEKACLTYATLTEQSYIAEQYGTSLKYIMIAMQCQVIVTRHMSSVSSQKQCLLGRAGDCYFQMAKNPSSIADNLKQFHRTNAVDESMKLELDKDLDQLKNDQSPMEVPELATPSNNIEELMLTSCASYEAALNCSTAKSSRREFISRLGSVLNELGIRYMHWAQEEYVSFRKNGGSDQAGQPEPCYQTFIKKSYDCLVRGIGAFEEINDNANLAILLCNMGRFMRFRAHVIMIGESNYDLGLKKKFYETAFTSYQRALCILDTRKQNHELWDLVTWELSTGTFTLAQHLIDHLPNPMTESAEQEIIDLLISALKICDTETPTERRNLYIHRQGQIYHRLAVIYNQALLRLENADESSETRRKKMLQLCRLYYEKSVRVLEYIDGFDEYIRVQVNRLELQDNLAASATGTSAKIRHHQQSLEIIQQSSNVLASVSNNPIDGIDEDLQQMVKHMQTTLRHLIKFCLTNKTAKLADTYKRLYSRSLRRDPGTVDSMASHLCQMAQALNSEIGKMPNIN